MALTEGQKASLKKYRAKPSSKKRAREYAREYHRRPATIARRLEYRKRMKALHGEDFFAKKSYAYYSKLENKERRRVARITRDHKISVDDYKELLSVHGFKCANENCKSVDALNNRLCVDHDHTTGSIRGLLCNSCNVALGLLKESPGVLRGLADYIEIHQNK